MGKLKYFSVLAKVFSCEGNSIFKPKINKTERCVSLGYDQEYVNVFIKEKPSQL